MSKKKPFRCLCGGNYQKMSGNLITPDDPTISPRYGLHVDDVTWYKCNLCSGLLYPRETAIAIETAEKKICKVCVSAKKFVKKCKNCLFVKGLCFKMFRFMAKHKEASRNDMIACFAKAFDIVSDETGLKPEKILSLIMETRP